VDVGTQIASENNRAVRKDTARLEGGEEREVKKACA